MPLLMTVGMIGSGFFGTITLLVTVAAVFGVGTYALGDQSVSAKEFWLSGAGFIVDIMGVWLAAVAFGFREERPWARPLATAFWFGMALFAVPMNWITPPSSPSEFWTDVVFSLLSGAIAAWYFYGKASVVSYYAAIRSELATADNSPATGA